MGIDRTRRLRSTLPLSLGLAACLGLAGCQPSPEPLYLSGSTMGTTWHVTVSQLPQRISRAAVQQVIDGVLDDTDRRLSTWREDSELSALNARRDDAWVPISGDLHEVLAAAFDVSASTDGAFDITVGPLVDLWGFGRSADANPVVPGAEALSAARAEVGYRYLALRAAPPAVRKLRPALRIDVAGIAPGYAVDRIVERLRQLGIPGALVEIGGEVKAWGRSPGARPWRIAVEQPIAGERAPYTLVELDGLGASTSGDYRDYRIVAGRRVSHTIDPRTGAPVHHGLASVTVLAPSAMMADAYATALMVLGPEEGYRYASAHRLAALFLERVPDRTAWRERVTPEFARLRRPLP